MHCQGSFFGPDVVHRCSGHLCILSRFLGANLSLSHLSVVLTLLHHLYAPINARILRSRGTLSMSLPGEVAGGWSSSRGLRSQTLIIFFLPSASHSLDDHSSHQMDRQISCLLLFPLSFFLYSAYSLSLFVGPLSGPQAPTHMLGRAGGSSIGSSASCALGSRGSIIILPLCSLPSDGFEPRLYSVCLFAFVRSCLFVIPPPPFPSLAPTLPPLPTFGRPHRV